ncbi:hypothetical protein ACQKM9_09150 [Viridibacillus sp. NPDC093762]|uniref:hypothetical protein n=1 Tax=Viridibacillus sp. NPDC093762 TaxID=3390720 RepID=UPI003CFC1942
MLEPVNFDEWFKKRNKNVYSIEFKRYEDILANHKELAHFYRKEIASLENTISKDIDSVIYTKGGETMVHRGYYCPSLVFTYIVGGTKRGKILKRFSKKFSFKYGFNKQGKLIYVQHNDEFGTQFQEFIIHDKDIEVGITVQRNNSISNISRCEYKDGKLLKYETSQLGMSKELYMEEYSYEGYQLNDVEIFCYTPSISLCERNRYKVGQNSDGEIVYLKGGCLYNGKWQDEEYFY